MFLQIAGFVVLGIVVLLVLLAVVLLVIFFIKKLKHQHEVIQSLERKLENIEKGQDNSGFEPLELRPVKKLSEKSNKRPDSGAHDLHDSDSYSTTGHISFNNPPIDLISTYADRPRFTIIVKEDRLNVFNKADASQLTAIAQKYNITERQSVYEVSEQENYANSAITDSDHVVSIDEIQIDTQKSVILDNASRTLIRKSVMDGRPTSLLLKTPQKQSTGSGNITHDKGMFVHRSIGPDGGTLEISDVVLEIPPDALEASTMVTLGVTWDEKLCPKLSKRQARLSPIIVCLPCIKFVKPVKLTFPHCAENILSDWSPTVLQRQGDVDEDNEWTGLTLADYDERDINATHVSIHLKHFTLYTLVGESKGKKVAAKRVKLVAFAKPLSAGLRYTSRFYCINDYENEIKVSARL